VKTVIVTGAAKGIGRAISLQLLKAGYTVIAADCDAEAGRGLVTLSDQLDFVAADIRKEPSVQQLIAKALERAPTIYGLVNNAGIGKNRPLTELSLDDWYSVIDTNLTGAFLCAKYAAPHMAEGGAIVNIASTRALMSEPHSEAYAASKGGLVALTHALAISLGPKLRVNAISPGWIETDPQAVHSDADKAQHPVGRVGTPDDIAQMTAYLLSEASGFITGQNFVIDGGMTKKMMYW
jgi:NAD(P)-dependent dehydrogenase (short-subunit alcohol dehydrogenase family)